MIIMNIITYSYLHICQTYLIASQFFNPPLKKRRIPELSSATLAKSYERKDTVTDFQNECDDTKVFFFKIGGMEIVY